MVAPPEALLLPRFIILVVGLIVPGAALMRALRVPATLATSFAGSALALYVTVLALQLANVTISFGSLGIGLLVITLVARRMAKLAAPPPAPEQSLLTRSRNHNLLTGMGAWTPLYFLILTTILWRVYHEPLAGPDVEFRWSFLAEQMLRLGSLDFYPPRLAADFYSYFWVESIPPGMSALHAWAYACAGGSMVAWTAPAVALQLWSVHDLIWRTAGAMGGLVAARFACLAAAACPFLTWSILIGQETGLTALSLVGICFAVYKWSETRAWGWAGLAGIFAVIGASAREYGLVFPFLAVVALLLVRADRRAWFAFMLIGSLAVIWPLRVWLLTGNPFYSLSLAGAFPVNTRFLAWIEHDADAFGAVLHTAAGWRDLARYLLLYAPTALLGWLMLVIGLGRDRRHALAGLIATAAVLALWAASVRYTNGGPFYSLRVASPAFALGALAAGIGLAHGYAQTRNAQIAVNVFLALACCATFPATLALPANPWRTSPREWPVFAQSFAPQQKKSDETVAIVMESLRAISGGSNSARPTNIVLADSPGYQRRFAPSGVRVIPPWSPQVDWLFNLNLSDADAARAWQKSNVTHLILTKWGANVRFFDLHSRWKRPPFQLQLVGETSLTAVFLIRAAD
jgi:hypothetical protein